MASTDENEPDRSSQRGWSTVDEQGRSSYLRDHPGVHAGDAETASDQDPERFEILASIDLDPEERHMLIRGLVDWGGPAYGSDVLAVAMGFASMAGLVDEAQTLIEAIKDERAL